MSRELLLAGCDGTEQTAGAWGLFRELGHNYSSDDCTFEGAGEVTGNLFALYLGERMCNLRPASHPRGSAQFRARQIARYDFSRPDFQKWKNDPGLALATYEQMLDAFGWTPFQKVFAEYRALPDSQRPAFVVAPLKYVFLFQEIRAKRCCPFGEQLLRFAHEHVRPKY